MDGFLEALVSEATCIPDEYDWFKPLLGDWDFDYFDRFDQPQPRHVEGEWIFRRVLEGGGIGDLFICPSRATREAQPQPDGEYGMALRMFNEREKHYDMTYATNRKMVRLIFRMEDRRLVGTVVDQPSRKWMFLNITETAFEWRNVTVLDDGTERINCKVFARRKSRECRDNPAGYSHS